MRVNNINILIQCNCMVGFYDLHMRVWLVRCNYFQGISTTQIFHHEKQYLKQAVDKDSTPSLSLNFNDDLFQQIKVRGPLRASLGFILVLQFYIIMENNDPSLHEYNHQSTRYQMTILNSYPMTISLYIVIITRLIIIKKRSNRTFFFFYFSLTLY